MKTGEIIWRQMLNLDRNLVMCMGVKKLCLIENGLRFYVNGLSFKGIVEITLNGYDLYNIKFIKKTRKQNPIAKNLGVKILDTFHEIHKEFNDVYFDQMMPIMEQIVENKR